MIGFLYHWFDWPSGSVLTNLIASGVCVGLAGWKLLAKLRKNHAHMQAQVDDLHDHIRAVHAHVKLVHDHQLANTPKPRQTRKA